MSDPRIPDDSESLDGLGLESLTDGVHPTADQWSSIGATAAHRRQRRTWLLAVAAMVVLVVGSAAVVLGRSDTDSVAISAGGLPTDSRLLPPKDATDVSAVRIGDTSGRTDPMGGSVIFFTDAAGRPWVLRQGLPRQMVLDAESQLGSTDTTATGAPTDTTATGTPAPGGPTTVEVTPFGTVWLTCAGSMSAGDTSGTTVTWVGPATAVFAFGNGAAFVSPNTDGSVGSAQPCTADDPVVDAVRDLRVVSAAEYDSYLGTVPMSFPEVSQTIVGTDDSGAVHGPPTTATAPEDPPVDRGSAEEQIAAAVAGFNDRAADGSYPNLEGGTTKAAEYADMFDTAGKQSGAAQAGDDGDNTSRLSRLRFVTPERASITIDFTAKLPTGTFTFPQDGEAILEDGRWVVTYRTVTTTLRRACVPPGGYDGCPSPGSNGVIAVPQAN